MLVIGALDQCNSVMVLLVEALVVVGWMPTSPKLPFLPASWILSKLD